MSQDPPETPNVTVVEDGTSFEVMDPHEVRAGDLLLVTRIPGEPLGELMQRLDGTVFSHSRLAVRKDGLDGAPATHLASAQVKTVPGDSRIDLGGVRWDAFSSFRPYRALYCIPMPEPRRRRALAYLARFHEAAGARGAFSVTKLVTVAAGLRSVELRASQPELAERIFTGARDVATVRAATHRTPSYYCAELVANAYGRVFTRGEMVPPRGAGYGIGDAIEEPRWFTRLMRRVDDGIDGIGSREWRSCRRLMGVLVAEDWDFLHHALTAVTRRAWWR